MREDDAAVAPGSPSAADPRRLLRVLRRQSAQPEVMAGFFDGVGAHGVVTALSSVAFGPVSEDVLEVAELPGLVRDGLLAAARWPDFDAEAFGAELADLLRDPSSRDTVAAITSYLLTSGARDARLLGGWSARFDDLSLPAAVPLRWSSFLVGDDGARSWSPITFAAGQFGLRELPGHRPEQTLP